MERGPKGSSSAADGVDSELPNAAYWGGNLELVVLSNILQVNVNIIQGEQIIYSTGVQHHATVSLYYTGAHYNIAKRI